jgi:hypothetical protein
MAAAAPIPIRRVRRDGQVDLLGEWRPDSKELVLDQPGFPLTPPGVHQIEGNLPWVFDEMCPDGYLARQLTRRYPELALPKDRILWTARQVLQIVTGYGAYLSGNLIVGERSMFRWLKVPPATPMNDFRPTLVTAYPKLIDDVLADPQGSSVGGMRPKLVIGAEDGTGLIVKFTPQLSTLLGTRWADLLRVEGLAAEALRAQGIDAVRTRYVEDGNRGYLEIDRFDRLVGGGRVGHVTLFNLGAAVYGEASDPIPVVAGLVRDGHLPSEDQARFQRIHAFSKAIGNDDTHLGNYGLLIDDEGNARLSPAYDVLPMAFAPKHDELPDRLVKHTGPRDAATEQLVQRLIAAVEADAGISKAFKEAWLRVVA